MFGEENIMFREENIMFGEENIMFGEENIMFREENIMFGEENIMFREENIMFGEENIMFGEENVSLNSSLCTRSFLLFPLTLSLFGPICYSLPYSQTPSSYVPPSMRVTKFHNHTKQQTKL